MPWPRSILEFIAKFAFAYALLLAPWPGTDAWYARGFRGVGQLAFGREADGRLVEFQPVLAELGHTLDTRILLAQRDPLDPAAPVVGHYLELDTRGVGRVPTALVLALILATPVSWRRRGRAMLWGLVAINAFVIFSVGVYIVSEAAALALISLAPFWREVGAGLEATLITQMGASFVVPVLVWMLVTLRRQELDNLAVRLLRSNGGKPSISPLVNDRKRFPRRLHRW